MRFLKRIFILVSMLAVVSVVSAQVDTEFWFAVPRLAHGHPGHPIKLCVSAFDQDAHVTVTKPATGATVTTFTVPANSSHTYTLVSNQAGLQGYECDPYNTVLNYGLYIHSDQKVNAYVAVQNNNSEIYALKGKNALGTQFYIPMQYKYENANYSGEGRNSIQIIATEDNTTVYITPSKNLYQSTHTAGNTFTVTLNKGQVYNIASNLQTPAGHLWGTIITSNKPIVVDVSDDSATPNGSNQDLVADQLVPEDFAGNEYVVVPSPTGAGNSTTSGGLSDYAFVFVLDDSTSVSIYYENNSGSLSQHLYENKMRGDTISYHFLNHKPIFIYSYKLDEETGMIEPKNIFVFQVTGAGNEVGGTQLPYINCTGSQRVTYQPLPHPSNHTKHLFLILICNQSVTNGFQIQTNTGNVTINNSEWSTIPGGGNLRYCQKDISNKATSQYIRISNSIGKFHMGMIDYHMEGSGYDDCSISYFSNYSSESELRWDTAITHFNYCQGDTIVFGFDTMDVRITRILGPGDFELESTPYWLLNAQPESSGMFTVKGVDSRTGCSTQLRDSIEITIHPSKEEILYDTICTGVEYSDNGFHFSADMTTVPGILCDSLVLQTSESGCDSLLVLQLIVRDNMKQEVVYDTVCPGYSYTGQYSNHFPISSDNTGIPRTIIDSIHLLPLDAAACDSLLILHLLVRDSVFGEFSQTACRSFMYNGHTYTKDTVVYNIVLQGASSHGCDSLVTMHLEIVEPEVKITTSGDDFCEFGELVLTAESEFDQFEWSTGETTPYISAVEPGTYTVTVSQGDCQATDHLTIPSCDFNLYIPNTITPSRSDGLNDYLYIPTYVHRFISDFDIEIFDRWGELIYKSNDINFRWAGEKAKVSEVYVWVIKVKNLDGKPFTYKGTITVL